MIDFTDIDKNLPNGENMGGLLQKVYFGYHSDVSSFPTKPVNPTALELASVLTGELVMKAGKETSARKGVSLEFQYKTTSAFIYTGNVPLTDGSGV